MFIVTQVKTSEGLKRILLEILTERDELEMTYFQGYTLQRLYFLDVWLIEYKGLFIQLKVKYFSSLWLFLIKTSIHVYITLLPLFRMIFLMNSSTTINTHQQKLLINLREGLKKVENSTLGGRGGSRSHFPLFNFVLVPINFRHWNFFHLWGVPPWGPSSPPP